MRKLVLALLAILTVANSTSDVHAEASDIYNRTAPAFSEENAGLSGSGEWLYVRRSDGTIWHKSVPNGAGGVAGYSGNCGAGGAGGGWVSDGAPTGQTASSGPQVGWTSTSFVQSWLFTETAFGLYVKPGSSGWQLVQSVPPGGFTAGITVSSDFNNGVMYVVARGGSNMLYLLQVTAPMVSGGALTVTPWSQIGTTSIASTPAIATPGYRRDVLSLNTSNQVQHTGCGFPTCWSTPAALPGPITSSYAPAAFWYDLMGANGGPFLAAAANVSGNAIVTVSTSGTWGSQTNRGGATISSALALAVKSSAPSSYRLAARFSDGTYRVNCAGPIWNSLGSP